MVMTYSACRTSLCTIGPSTSHSGHLITEKSTRITRLRLNFSIISTGLRLLRAKKLTLSPLMDTFLRQSSRLPYATYSQRVLPTMDALRLSSSSETATRMAASLQLSGTLTTRETVRLGISGTRSSLEQLLIQTQLSAVMMTTGWTEIDLSLVWLP